MTILTSVSGDRIKLASKEAVADYIDQVEKQQVVYHKVRTWLADNWQGRDITQRMVTALNKAFPDLRFRLSDPYSWWSLKVSGEGVRVQYEMDMNIGYKSHSKAFSLESFDYNTQCYALDVGRLPQYKETLVNYDQLADAYNKAFDALRVAESGLGCLSYQSLERNHGV